MPEGSFRSYLFIHDSVWVSKWIDRIYKHVLNYKSGHSIKHLEIVVDEVLLNRFSDVLEAFPTCAPDSLVIDGSTNIFFTHDGNDLGPDALQEQAERFPKEMYEDCGVFLVRSYMYILPFKYNERAQLIRRNLPDKSNGQSFSIGKMVSNHHAESQFPIPVVHGQLTSGGYGAVDDFGFRHDDLTSLYERDENHVVIGCFGGSTTFGSHCVAEDAWPSVLQRLLTESCDDKKVTVVNFGLPSYFVLSQMTAYLYFCHELKPDIVISHDPVNDLILGCMTDPYLLRKYDLTLSQFGEEWIRRMYNAERSQLTQKNEIFEPASSPQQVVLSYLRRKKQFQDLVAAHDNHFVWGRQAVSFHKLHKSPFENAMLNFFKKDWQNLSQVVAGLPIMYQILEKLEVDVEISCFVNHVDSFAEQGADIDLFQDFCHLTPEGEELVARNYQTAILPILNKIWRDTNA